MTDYWGVLFSLLSAFCFSTEGFATSAALRQGIAIPFILAGRYTIAALILWLVAAFRFFRREEPSPRAARLPLRTWLVVAIIGILGYGGTTSALTTAFTLIPTSLAIIVLYAYPTLVALGELILGWDQPRMRSWMAIALTLAGLAIITRVSWDISSPLGLLLAFAAAVLNTVQVLFSRHLLQFRDSFTLTLVYVSAAAAFLCLVLVTGGFQGVVTVGGIPGTAWLSLLSLAVFPTLLAILFLNLGIERLGASRASIFSTTEPVFAALLGIILLQERWTAAQASGALLIIAGLLLISWPENEKNQAGV